MAFILIAAIAAIAIVVLIPLEAVAVLCFAGLLAITTSGVPQRMVAGI